MPTILRLRRLEGMWPVFARQRGLNRKPGPPVHDDSVKQDFTAMKASGQWLAEITEHPTKHGKLYLCAVNEVYSASRPETA